MRFGLLGKNISYSYSKLIHEFVFKYYNLPHTYDVFDITKDNLDGFMAKLKSGEISGINVTIPYKEEVMKYLDEIDDNALKLGNVNTIINVDGKLIGYNTDYSGFNYMLEYYDIVPNSDSEVYILGTGGAAKTVYNVFKNYTNNITFVSRDKIDYNIISYDDLRNKDISYLVNATPMGDQNHLESLLVSDQVISKAKVVIDLIYNPRQTKLLKKANSLYNGLVMLIYQALEAEKLFLNTDIDSSLIEKVGVLFE